MLKYHDALNRILDHVTPLPPKHMPLGECLGLVLAEGVLAKEDIPCYDNSAMDGYAVRAEDTSKASAELPSTLRILERVPAGQKPTAEVEVGTAVKVMTGGMIPSGADAVIQVERAKDLGDVVCFERPAEPGQSIRPAGEDLKKGELALSSGTELNPYRLALLAAVGAASPLVYPRPKVAVLPTGSELLPIGSPLAPGKVRDSASVAIAAQLREMGAVPAPAEIKSDIPEEIEAALIELAESADAVITIGAVSMGDHDCVRPAVEKLGEVIFWKVAIRPGSPFLFGQLRGKPFFGLPGNPTSAMVTFEMLARPALMKMMCKVQRPTTARAISETSIHTMDGRRNFIRGTCASNNGVLKAKPVGAQSSGLHKPMAQANCLIIIPEDVMEIKSGDEVEVVWLGGMNGIDSSG